MQDHLTPPTPFAAPNMDVAEVARFSELAKEWWDPAGRLRPLHQLGPARMAFIRKHLGRHFSLGDGGLRPFKGLTVLDVGCGGGLISEPLARLGAAVTGIDASPEAIGAARAHAAAQGLPISYQAIRIEDLAAPGRGFDAVCCLEVLEHVPDPGAFLASCAERLRPGGIFVLSTINRTLKSYALAIVAAEYVLGWLPRGTHRWDRFVRPDELQSYLRNAGLDRPLLEGLVYAPMRDEWQLGEDVDVNYMAAGAKPDRL